VVRKEPPGASGRVVRGEPRAGRGVAACPLLRDHQPAGRDHKSTQREGALRPHDPPSGPESGRDGCRAGRRARGRGWRSGRRDPGSRGRGRIRRRLPSATDQQHGRHRSHRDQPTERRPTGRTPTEPAHHAHLPRHQTSLRPFVRASGGRPVVLPVVAPLAACTCGHRARGRRSGRGAEAPERTMASRDRGAATTRIQTRPLPCCSRKPRRARWTTAR